MKKIFYFIIIFGLIAGQNSLCAQIYAQQNYTQKPKNRIPARVNNIDAYLKKLITDKLIPQLEHPLQRKRNEAVKILAALGPKAVPFLLEILNDRDNRKNYGYKIIYGSMRALGKIAKPGRAAEKAVSKYLHASYLGDRVGALKALAGMKAEGAAIQIKELATDRNETDDSYNGRTLRDAALKALAGIGEESSIVDACDSALRRDCDVNIRYSAIMILSACVPKQYKYWYKRNKVLTLAIVLKEYFASFYRGRAIEALGAAKYKPAAYNMYKIIVDETEDINLRLNCIKQLMKIQPHRLCKIAGKKWIRSSKNMDKQRQEQILRIRDFTVRMFAENKYRGSIEALQDILLNPREDTFLRVNCAYALGEIKDKRAIRPLRKVLKNPRVDNQIRAQAMTSILQIADNQTGGFKETIGDFLWIMNNKDDNQSIRVAVVAALIKLKKTSINVIPAFIYILTEPCMTDDIKEKVINSLSDLDQLIKKAPAYEFGFINAGFLISLFNLTQHEDERVRQFAYLVLEKVSFDDFRRIISLDRLPAKGYYLYGKYRAYYNQFLKIIQTVTFSKDTKLFSPNYKEYCIALISRLIQHENNDIRQKAVEFVLKNKSLEFMDFYKTILTKRSRSNHNDLEYGYRYREDAYKILFDFIMTKANKQAIGILRGIAKDYPEENLHFQDKVKRSLQAWEERSKKQDVRSKEIEKKQIKEK